MQAIAAYMHFLGLAVMSACLVAEYCLLNPAVHAASLRILKRIDGVYGLTAGIMFASGYWRLHVEKGMEYYTSSTWFWAKMTLFAITALASLYPTVYFLRKPLEAQVLRADTIRRYLRIQGFLIAGIIGCAVIMARG